MDLGTRERGNHGDGMVAESMTQSGAFRARVKHALRLDVYQHRSELDRDSPFRNGLLAEAGRRLRRLFFDSHAERRVIASYAENVSDRQHKAFRSDGHQSAAGEAYRAALASVRPSSLGVVRHVCIDDVAVYKDGAENPLPAKEARARMTALRDGLADLLDHFTNQRRTIQ